ncbi:MAG: hypothetical protein JO345_12015 [Streptosporangiaceae bacterium]|nr:hypothetical protein [Streptosporangiaceae bacterium]
MAKKSPASEAARALAKRRAQKLTPERRAEIARKAGKAGGRGRPKKED